MVRAASPVKVLKTRYCLRVSIQIVTFDKIIVLLNWIRIRNIQILNQEFQISKSIYVSSRTKAIQ
jgi:hypothetical protein